MERNSRAFLLLTMGFLSAFAPLVTDMYLPGLPAMVSYFHTTAPMIQLGITASMIGLAAGQLLIGPISDKYGRRRPLIASLLLFIVATVLCIFAWDIGSFIAFRLLQGAAGAGGIVLSRSVSADLFKGRDLAAFMAMIAAINGIAPICAPVIGGVLLSFTSWQGVFAVLLFLGFVLLGLGLRLRESLPEERRMKAPVLSTFRRFGPVLAHRKFMRYVLVQAFAMAVMFAYVSSSPFIFQGRYHLTPLVYSIYFAANAFAIMAGSVTTTAFCSSKKAMRFGALMLLVMGGIFGICLAESLPFLCVCVPLFFVLFSVGVILPTSSALALDCERRNAGTASAVLGASGFIFGGIVTPLAGMGNIFFSTGLVMTVSALCAFGFSLRSRLAEDAAADAEAA